jgi:hypothetical protein
MVEAHGRSERGDGARLMRYRTWLWTRNIISTFVIGGAGYRECFVHHNPQGMWIIFTIWLVFKWSMDGIQGHPFVPWGRI